MEPIRIIGVIKEVISEKLMGDVITKLQVEVNYNQEVTVICYRDLGVKAREYEIGTFVDITGYNRKIFEGTTIEASNIETADINKINKG